MYMYNKFVKFDTPCEGHAYNQSAQNKEIKIKIGYFYNKIVCVLMTVLVR